MELGAAQALDRLTGAASVALTGAYVITMDPALGDLVGDVLLTGDRIAAVGPAGTIPFPADAVVIDAAGAIVLPGLVDAHVHAWEGALRGCSPDSDFGDYMTLTHGTLGPVMTPSDVAAGQRITAATALAGGITTIVDNSHNSRSPEHSDAAVTALLDSGIRAVHAVGVGMDQPGPHLPADLLRLRDAYGGGRITFRVMDVAPTGDSWRFAAEHGFGTVTELGGWIPGLDGLLRDGPIGPRSTFNHAAGLSDEQWRLLAGSGAAVNVVPRSDPYYGIGAAVPILAADRFGLQVGISTDNEFEYGQDLFTEMRMLLTVQRGLAFAAADGTRPYGVRDALRAATVGGALNAGLPDAIGSLAPGKKADVSVLGLNRIGLRPMGSLLGAVVNFAGPADVSAVFVDGAVRVWGGELVGVDVPALVAEAEASRGRVLGRVGVRVEELRFAGALTVHT